jgi:Tol biopolymer transport system component
VTSLNRFAVAACAALCAVALCQRLTGAQAPQDPAERARNNARQLEQNARTLTLFDRAGKVVTTIAERHIFNQPTLSPDAKRIALIKPDLDKETQDVWVYDIASGKGVQLTSNKQREGVQSPAWSPDGRFVAYVALRGSRYTILRKLSDGSGAEETIYAHEGGPIVLTDWSLDGRYLSFYTTDLSGSTLFLLPIDGDRRPIETAKSDKEMVAARLSPDSRLLAYRSNETGKMEIFVRSVPPPGTQAKVDKWQITTEGGYGMVWWKRDGRELFFFGPDRVVMSVEVKSGPGTFEFSKPRPLFKSPESIPAQSNPGAFGSVSRDGERIVFSVPPMPPQRQLTVFDRTGKEASRIGPPGLYLQPSVSPDGSKVAVTRPDPQTGNNDIWVFDIATGKGTQVTTSAAENDAAPIWFDNNRIAYVSTRGNFAGIYRKQWTGQGAEEQLFRYTAGAGMVLTDFSPDGRFAMIDGGGIILAIPLTGTDPLKREAADFARSEFDAGAGRFSPDGRLVAFGANDTGRFEVYVRPFDAKTGEAAGETKWKISNDAGVIGGLVWRRDGRELFYHVGDNSTNEIKVMAVEVTTTPEFKASAPKELFRLKGPLPGNPNQWKHITADGQRFVFAVPQPATASR